MRKIFKKFEELWFANKYGNGSSNVVNLIENVDNFLSSVKPLSFDAHRTQSIAHLAYWKVSEHKTGSSIILCQFHVEYCLRNTLIITGIYCSATFNSCIF